MLSKSLLASESGAVLPGRETMAIVNVGISVVSSRINANSAFVSLVNRAAGNSVVGAAGSTVSVNQTVLQTVGNSVL